MESFDEIDVKATLANAQPPQITILYVEDNAANLALVEAILARRGHIRLISATNALSGIALARAELPMLILMDMKLPDICGSEALQMLQEDTSTAHIPVIALSSGAYIRQIENGLKAGFYRYLTKPFKIDEFNDAVDAGLQLAWAGTERLRHSG